MWHHNVLSVGLAVAFFSACAKAHISLITPCPRYSSMGVNCPKLPAGQVMDTEMNKPIYSEQLGGQMPLCKHTVPWPTPAATWTAGEKVKIQFSSLAVSHSGGHAEFSISYDGGHTFVVIQQVLRFVFVGKKPAAVTNEVSVYSYEITLPKGLPSSDKAIFAWTWVNASGNREFYMNCADVAIKGTSKSITGKNVTIVNYPGYPVVPEFNMNYETGIQYYTTNAKFVTVYGNGKSVAAKAADSNIAYEGVKPVNMTNIITGIIGIASELRNSANHESSSDGMDYGEIHSRDYLLNSLTVGPAFPPKTVTIDDSDKWLGVDWCDDETDSDESLDWCDDEFESPLPFETASHYALPVVPTKEPGLMCDVNDNNSLYHSDNDVYYSGVYVSNTFLASDMDLNPLVLNSVDSDDMVTVTMHETVTQSDEHSSGADDLGGLDSESSSDHVESSSNSLFSFSSTNSHDYPQFEFSASSSSQ